MVDTKISGLTPDAAPTLDDLLVLVNDPGGTPGSRRATVQALLDLIEASIDLDSVTVTANFIDVITQISSGLKSGSDGTLITGTAGVSGNLSSWNADGDLIDSGTAVPVGTIVGTNDNQTLTNKTMTGSANTFNFDLADITLTGTVTEFNAALDSDTFATWGSDNVYTGTQDFGASASLEIPNGAAPTVDADGEVAVDTTVTDFSHGIMKYFSGEEMAVIAVPIAQLTSPTDGDVIAYNATANEFQLSAGGGGGGDAWGDTVDADILYTGAGSTYDIGAATATVAEIHVDDCYIYQGLVVTEAADHPVTPVAGQGQLWISDGATQELMFTDDGGSDRTVLTSTSGASLTAATIGSADSVFFADADDSSNSKITTVSNFLSDLSIVTLGASQTLTSKTLTTPLISHTVVTDANNRTLEAGDQSAILRMTSGSANTITIPTNASVAFPIGTVMQIWSEGAGTTTIAGDTGVTLQGAGGSVSAGSCDIQTQYGGATLTKVATDTWNIAGDIDQVA